MEPPESPELITELLQGVRSGNRESEERLTALVYRELHTMAARFMQGERWDHVLQPTALVNETYIRLLQNRSTDWKNRAHFFAVTSRVMQHVLVDYARRRVSSKRGAGENAVSADVTILIAEDRTEGLLVVEDLLRQLEQEDTRVAQIVTHRVFGGLTVEEIAEVLNVSTRTVKRDWSYGRAWLKARLHSVNGDARVRSQAS